MRRVIATGDRDEIIRSHRRERRNRVSCKPRSSEPKWGRPVKQRRLGTWESRFPVGIRRWNSPKLLDSLTSGHYSQRVLEGLWDVLLRFAVGQEVALQRIP